MEIPPSNFRQPPDGHEFPDFIEAAPKAPTFSSPFFKSNEPHECPSYDTPWNDISISKPNRMNLERSISNSNLDLRLKLDEPDEQKCEDIETSNLLSTRSQSMIDMSMFAKEKNSSKWNILAEQRKKRMSKLKGLVIPEASENDLVPQVNIPEIKSITTSQLDIAMPEINSNASIKSSSNTGAPIILPSWNPNPAIPKYSPAFKRKNLQVYPVSTVKKTSDDSVSESSYDEYINKYSDSAPSSRNSDDPKSLESIASPTRSDCSFDYVGNKNPPIRYQSLNTNKDCADSDNDSAVSSSQSSYDSRSSPPSSPVPEANSESARMLRPFSIEAINRKNILASAKCRSGKDIKIGSPVIQRKNSSEEQGSEDTEESSPVCKNEDTSAVKEETKYFNTTLVRVQSEEAVELEPQPNQVKFITKEPVAQEVSLEKSRVLAEQVNDKLEEKPIPKKRTLPTASQEKPKIISDESKLNKLLGRNSASSLLESRNKPINIQSIKANFENSSTSMPVFPKQYNYSNTANTDKPHLPKRRSEDNILNMKKKFEDNKVVRQISQVERPNEEKISRRLSSGSINSGELTKYRRSSTLSDADLTKNQYSSKGELDSCNTVLSRTSRIEMNLDKIGSSLGITLAGGIDYENKIVTIHRIRYGSVAYQDGRLKKGDKVLSINGHPTVGMTHSTASELLREPCNKFSIVIEDSTDPVPLTNLSRRSSNSVTSLCSESKGPDIEVKPPVSSIKQPTQTVSLNKDGAGLGFSIEGGKDSPKGDVPLVVKKIFAGGAADKCGDLHVGDEILAINNISFQNMSRIDAWSQMKKIPEGLVKIDIFR